MPFSSGRFASLQRYSTIVQNSYRCYGDNWVPNSIQAFKKIVFSFSDSLRFFANKEFSKDHLNYYEDTSYIKKGIGQIRSVFFDPWVVIVKTTKKVSHRSDLPFSEKSFVLTHYQ